MVAYNTLRTETLSITYDEAATYLWHVHYKAWSILRFRTSGLPDNNHVLTTLLGKWSIAAFGDTLFALRLPSAALFAVYCISAAAILRRALSGPLLVLSLLFATLNPAVVDLMSIARGYGLGIALATLGIYALLRGRDASARVGWTWLAAAALGLATLAHLTFVLFYVVASAIVCVELAADLWRGRASLRMALTAATGPALAGMALVPFVIHQLRVLQPLGLLNTEGLTSFYFDTVKTTVAASLFEADTTHHWIDLICCLACAAPLLGVAALLATRVSRVGLGPRRRDLSILLTFLLGVCLLSVLQHALFHVAFLSGRRAACLIPLFVFCAAATVGLSLRGASTMRWVAAPVLVAIAVASTVQFATAIRLDKTRDWGFDADVSTMIPDLRARAACSGRTLRLGTDWLFDTVIDYYLARDHISSIAAVDQADHRGLAARLGPGAPYDAYYIQASDLERLVAAFGPQTVVRRYPVSDTLLLVPSTAHDGCADPVKPASATG